MNKSKYDIEFDECPMIIKKFLFYIKTIKGRENNTVRTYYYSLKHFFLYILYSVQLITKDELDSYNKLRLVNIDLLQAISTEKIYSYLYYCSQHNNSSVTRAKKLSAIKQYFAYLQKHENLIAENPAANIETPKKPKRIPKHLSEEQSISLLNAVEGDFFERDYCILVLFLNCGLRISELVNLNYKDIKGNNYLVIHGKGNKEREVPLNNSCITSINEYKKVRPVNGLKDRDAFFISRQNNRMSSNTIRAMLKKNLKKIGLDGQGISPHKLRHTAATLTYKGGGDLRSLQELLGHENLSTTEIYTHISSEQIKEATNNNPLANLTRHKSNNHSPTISNK